MMRTLDASRARPHRGRFGILVAVLVVAVALASSDAGRDLVRSIFTLADGLIAAHPHAGVIVFVVLAALSAMLAFLSSAVLLPVAIHVWGDRTTFGLLWLGWLLGGVASYTIGRYLGRSAVQWIVPVQRLRHYERQLAGEATFGRVLLFHLLVPSEIPGYVLGLLRYPFCRYIAILAIAEIPFALGAVYLGSSFVDGNLLLFIGLAALAIAISLFTTRWFLRAIDIR
jgi:uncharacterized membrane protein YdjX (TVP38/TMEM64 family)